MCNWHEKVWTDKEKISKCMTCISLLITDLDTMKKQLDFICNVTGYRRETKDYMSKQEVIK